MVVLLKEKNLCLWLKHAITFFSIKFDVEHGQTEYVTVHFNKYSSIHKPVGLFLQLTIHVHHYKRTRVGFGERSPTEKLL